MRAYQRLTPAEIARIKEMREDGCPIREIARTLDRPLMTISQCAARLGLSPEKKGGMILTRAERKLAQDLGIQVV